MERRDNYEMALREEEEALRASMGKNRGTAAASGAVLEGENKAVTPKRAPIAPRWERAQREKDKKKKQKQ